MTSSNSNSIFHHDKQHPQQNRLEKKLNREYINLAKELEKISKYPRDHIEHQWNLILDRQLQIVLELEHLTGKKILMTEEEILEENKQIQAQAEAQRIKFEKILEEVRRKEKESKIPENKIWRDQRINKEGNGLDSWL